MVGLFMMKVSDAQRNALLAMIREALEDNDGDLAATMTTLRHALNGQPDLRRIIFEWGLEASVRSLQAIEEARGE